MRVHSIFRAVVTVFPTQTRRVIKTRTGRKLRGEQDSQGAVREYTISARRFETQWSLSSVVGWFIEDYLNQFHDGNDYHPGLIILCIKRNTWSGDEFRISNFSGVNWPRHLCIGTKRFVLRVSTKPKTYESLAKFGHFSRIGGRAVS